MKCPTCGFENEDGAKFCVQCGGRVDASEPVRRDNAVEAAPTAGSPAVGEDASEAASGGPEGESETVLEGEDAAAPAAASVDPVLSTEEKPAKAQGEEAPKNAKGFFSKLVAKYGSKRLGIAGGIVAVALVVIIAVVALFGDGPSDSLIKQDIEKAEISWGGTGEFDSREPFQISSVEVTSKEKVDVPKGLFGGRLGDTAYEVKATVKASNGSVDSEAVVTADYVKYQGTWQAFSSPSVESETATPVAGITEDALKAGAQTILSKADGNNRMAENSLSTIYADAKVDVDKVDFDKEAKTCTATMKYAVEDAFSSAKATVTADFAYENNTWSLMNAKADDKAKTVSYDKLVGTWKGTFEKTGHGKSRGSDCYGAKSSVPELTITSVDPNSLKVEGTFSGMVHDHGELSSDANATEGDRTVEAMPFTATLEEKSQYGRVGTEYTLPVEGGNTLRITFGFGTNRDDDPNGAFIKVYYCYQCDVDAIFLPDQQEKWVDTYRLTKAE